MIKDFSMAKIKTMRIWKLGSLVTRLSCFLPLSKLNWETCWQQIKHLPFSFFYMLHRPWDKNQEIQNYIFCSQFLKKMFRLFMILFQFQIVPLYFYVWWEFSIYNLHFLSTLCRVSVPYFSKLSDQQMTPMQITVFSYFLLFSLNFLIYCVAGH